MIGRTSEWIGGCAVGVVVGHRYVTGTLCTPSVAADKSPRRVNVDLAPAHDHHADETER